MATEVVARNRQSSVSDAPAMNGHDARVAARIWSRMTEIYGHRWASAMGEAPTESWSMAIGQLSHDELKRGLRACMTSGEAWPPSLPQFVAMCRPPRRENAAAYRYDRQLPAPVSTRERAQTELAAMRARLRGAA